MRKCGFYLFAIALAFTGCSSDFSQSPTEDLNHDRYKSAYKRPWLPEKPKTSSMVFNAILNEQAVDSDFLRSLQNHGHSLSDTFLFFEARSERHAEALGALIKQYLSAFSEIPIDEIGVAYFPEGVFEGKLIYRASFAFRNENWRELSYGKILVFYKVADALGDPVSVYVPSLRFGEEVYPRHIYNNGFHARIW